MDLTRRQVLAGVAGGTAALGGGVATYNVVLGYDPVTGTNLRRQALDAIVAADIRPTDGDLGAVGGYRLAIDRGDIVVSDGASPVASIAPTADVAEAAALDDELTFDGSPLADLVADLSAIDAGEVTFTYANYADFFEQLSAQAVRPRTVAALRNGRWANPATVAAVTDADPTDPLAIVEGLADGFREHTRYDLPRYLAGSIEDNVIFGRRDLRRHFESSTDFEAILAGEDTGLFCYDLVFRSIEALHAVSAHEQTPPVFAGYVHNERHKHAFTAIASVYRSADGLVVPVTFVDYTRSTLYDDLRLRWLLGEGLEAYTTRQRATEIYWTW